MAQHRKPPSPQMLTMDRAILTALQSLTDYAPRSADHTPASLQALNAAVVRDQQALDEAERVVAEARKRAVASAWALHDAVSAAKVEVTSQYGVDSYAMRFIGRTPRSERKRSNRRKADV